MKGGYDGVSERNDDGCPICGESYDRYIPADSDFEPDKTADRLCVAVSYGNYANGLYIHLETLNTTNKDALSRTADD